MVGLDTVRSSNDALVRGRTTPFVAVFAGATAGLGSNILERLALTEAATYHKGKSQGLRIYLIGRNEQAASKVLARCRSVNSHSQYTFVKVEDLGSINDIDEACGYVTSTETRHALQERRVASLDLLVCSQGGTFWTYQSKLMMVRSGHTSG